MRRLSALLLPLLALVPTAARAAEPWPAECKLQLAASLPFTIEHGHVRIEAALNGTPRHFIIDTGGFMSSVTERVVADQNLKTFRISDAYDIGGVGGGRTKRYAVADTLSFARLKANDVHLLVEPGGAGDEDGVIAPDYLRNFDLEFDFATGTLNLFQPHPCPDHAVYWPGNYVVLPMDVTAQGHIRVLTNLDGKDFEAMLDTGSPSTLIGERTASAQFQLERGDAESGTMTGGTGASTKVWPHRFGALQLGGITINHPPLLVSADETAWRSDHADVLLGLNELSKLHLYIAYRERKLYVSPRAAAP
jgi:predicted aspartyl protease